MSTTLIAIIIIAVIMAIIGITMNRSRTRRERNFRGGADSRKPSEKRGEK
ncbi:MAG: hypothetical protein IT315_10020 [Anaerolineales bacterium]|nr:hypothetical protein [Anaerolineales bacterium]